MDREKLNAYLRKACDKAGSQAAWAKATGLSPAYVSDVIAGRREPGAKLLDALSVERIVTYRLVTR